MSKRALIIAITLLLFAPWAYSQPPIAHNYKPAQGYVPDAATAIKIAVAVWEPIYGQECHHRPKMNPPANGKRTRQTGISG
jgi:hypothetical protein